MKFRGDFLGQPSGSIGGITFSHNRGGYYIRHRSVPTNPNTARQQAVRAAFGQLASRWSNILTQTQRDAWALYGANVPITNSLGEPLSLTGQQMYVRTNTPIIQIGATIIDDAPTTFNLGDFTAPTIVSAGVAAGLSVGYDNNDSWANNDDGKLLIYQGQTKSPGVEFFKGPFRLVGSVDGITIAPPVSPEVFATPAYALSLDNKCWIAARALQPDGRLSQRVIIGPETIIA